MALFIAYAMSAAFMFFALYGCWHVGSGKHPEGQTSIYLFVIFLFAIAAWLCALMAEI
jgi:hypothetical protein